MAGSLPQLTVVSDAQEVTRDCSPSIYFEGLSVGMRFQTVLSRAISRDMIDAYFELTGDTFGIHSDDDFALAQGFKAAMVPGNLVVAVATGLVFAAGYFSDSLVVQARKDIKFVAPLYVDEQIYVTDEVIRVADRPLKPYGQVVLCRLTFNARHEVIQRVEQDYRVLKVSSLIERPGFTA